MQSRTKGAVRHIDTRAGNVELDKYNERVGDECGVRLTLPGPDHLQVEIFTDWYNDFASLVDDASEEIELDPKAALEKMQKAAKDKE